MKWIGFQTQTWQSRICFSDRPLEQAYQAVPKKLILHNRRYPEVDQEGQFLSSKF